MTPLSSLGPKASTQTNLDMFTWLKFAFFVILWMLEGSGEEGLSEFWTNETFLFMIVCKTSKKLKSGGTQLCKFIREVPELKI